MFLVLKLLVFYVWCCDGMRLGVQVMSACLVDMSVAGRVAILVGQYPIIRLLHGIKMKIRSFYPTCSSYFPLASTFLFAGPRTL